MDPIEFGAKQAVLHCLSVSEGERTVVITDRHTEPLANALIAQIKNQKAQAEKFVMEDFGDRPDDGSTPLPFPDAIRSSLEQAKVSFYIARGKMGELQSFRVPMLTLVETHKIRHGHMPGFTEQMMSQGMAADYQEIQKLSKKVFNKVTPAKTIRITTPAGTDLTATFDPDTYKWIICDGYITPGNWSNLPDGEVFTMPVDAEGTVVVDGCLGDFFTEKYGDLKNTPVHYKLKNSRCVEGSVICKNPELKKDFETYTFDTDENSRRLGEFAIGTNIGLKELVGNLLQDEKFPGIHLALGSPYPEKTGATWNSKAHNDGVLRNPTIIVDGEQIMKDGVFTL